MAEQGALRIVALADHVEAEYTESGRFRFLNGASSFPPLEPAVASDEKKILKTTEISKMKGQGLNSPFNSKLVAVNPMYIIYAMKEGFLRVINQSGKDMFKVNNTTKSVILDLTLNGSHTYGGYPSVVSRKDPSDRGATVICLDEAARVSIFDLDAFEEAKVGAKSEDKVRRTELVFQRSDAPRRVIGHPTERGTFITLHAAHIEVWNLYDIDKEDAHRHDAASRSFHVHGLANRGGLQAVLPEENPPAPAGTVRLLDAAISIDGSCLMALATDGLFVWRFEMGDGVALGLQLIQQLSISQGSDTFNPCALRVVAQYPLRSPGQEEILIVGGQKGCQLLLYRLLPSADAPVGPLLQSIQMSKKDGEEVVVSRIEVNVTARDCLAVSLQDHPFVLLFPLAKTWVSGNRLPMPYVQRLVPEEPAHQLCIMTGKSLHNYEPATIFMYRAHNFTREKDNLPGCNVVVNELIKPKLLAPEEGDVRSLDARPPRTLPKAPPGSFTEPEAPVSAESLNPPPGLEQQEAEAEDAAVAAVGLGDAAGSAAAPQLPPPPAEDEEAGGDSGSAWQGNVEAPEEVDIQESPEVVPDLILAEAVRLAAGGNEADSVEQEETQNNSKTQEEVNAHSESRADEEDDSETASPPPAASGAAAPADSTGDEGGGADSSGAKDAAAAASGGDDGAPVGGLQHGGQLDTDWGFVKQVAASFVKGLEKRRNEMADKIANEVAEACRGSNHAGETPGDSAALDLALLEQALAKVREAREAQAAADKGLQSTVRKATESWAETSAATVSTLLQKELGKFIDGVATSLAQQLSQSRRFCEALAKAVQRSGGVATKQALEALRPPRQLQETVGAALTEALHESLGPVFRTELRAHFEQELAPLIGQRVSEMMASFRDRMGECLEGIAVEHEQAAKRLGRDLAPIIAEELRQVESVVHRNSGAGSFSEEQLDELVQAVQGEVIQPLEKQIRDLSAQVQALREEASELKKKWSAVAISGVAGDGRPSAGVPSASDSYSTISTADAEEAQARDLEVSFREGKAEEAFVKALRLQSQAKHEDFLGRLCKLVHEPVDAWLDQTSLSMPVKMRVILALARQLEGKEMSDAVSRKVDWINELWYAFDPADNTVADNVSSFLQQLSDVLERVGSGSQSEVAKQLKNLRRFVCQSQKMVLKK